MHDKDAAKFKRMAQGSPIEMCSSCWYEWDAWEGFLGFHGVVLTPLPPNLHADPDRPEEAEDSQTPTRRRAKS